MTSSETADAAPVTTRFAPSPTGLLHLGHAYSALLSWRRARAAGGRFLLRFEDIDPARCDPAHAAAILADLAWLGLDWDGPVRFQSEHMPAYRAVLDRMAGEGLLYPCFCSRGEILRELARSSLAPHQAPDGGLLYPGTCASGGMRRGKTWYQRNSWTISGMLRKSSVQASPKNASGLLGKVRRMVLWISRPL